MDKKETQSVDIPSMEWLNDYICVDITSWQTLKETMEREYNAEKKKQILESIHDLLAGFDLYTAKDILHCVENGFNYNAIIQSRKQLSPPPNGQQQ